MSQFKFVYKQPLWMPIVSITATAAGIPAWILGLHDWFTCISILCFQTGSAILLWAAIRARNEYRSRLEADFAFHLTNLIRTENPNLVRFTDKKMPSQVLEEAVKEVQE